MPLTEVVIKSSKPREKPYKLADGSGMFLLINPNGSRLWRLKYRFGGKEKLLALGSYPAIGLKQARDYRDAARQLLKDGRDPTLERKLLKQTNRVAHENSFDTVAREFVKQQVQRWSTKHTVDVLHRLETYIFPYLGTRPIGDISAPELLDVVRKIESRGATHLAHRMLQTCGQVFRYGIATGCCSRDVAADLRGALAAHVAKHMAAVSPKELPELLTAIGGYDGETTTRLGLQLLALTFVRTNELIGAQWSEIDMTEAMWSIPAQRMKMKDEHLVPLSRQSLAILKELHELNSDSHFVFAAANRKKHISNNTLLYALYRLGYHSRVTGHGFRAVASTILNEARERGEHTFGERNKVRAAYNRAKYIQERIAMMQWWADFLDRQVGGQFIPL